MGLKSNIAIAIDHSLLMTKAGLPPDPWQAKVLRDRDPRLLLNCARQSGKTAVMAAAAVIEALYYAPSVVLILCPAIRQSKELFRAAIAMWQLLGAEIVADSLTTTSVDFPTGSRIIALPSTEKNIRGFSSISLLILDEASRVPDDLYNTVRPMLAVSNGRIACLSTPFGKRGFFHEEWTKGAGWTRVQITALENPRISSEFLAEEKRKLPDAWFRQEYMCEFAETTDAVFAYADVQAALTGEVEPLYLDSGMMITGDVAPLTL